MQNLQQQYKTVATKCKFLIFKLTILYMHCRYLFFKNTVDKNETGYT